MDSSCSYHDEDDFPTPIEVEQDDGFFRMGDKCYPLLNDSEFSTLMRTLTFESPSNDYTPEDENVTSCSSYHCSNAHSQLNPMAKEFHPQSNAYKGPTLPQCGHYAVPAAALSETVIGVYPIDTDINVSQNNSLFPARDENTAVPVPVVVVTINPKIALDESNRDSGFAEQDMIMPQSGYYVLPAAALSRTVIGAYPLDIDFTQPQNAVLFPPRYENIEVPIPYMIVTMNPQLALDKPHNDSGFAELSLNDENKKNLDDDANYQFA